MGIETKISSMEPRKRKLIENVISVSIIFIIVYAFITFVSIYQAGGDIYSFFNAGVLFPIILPLILLYFFGYRIIKGGKINIPQQPQQTQEKKQFNIPNVWGDTGFKGTQRPLQQKPPQPQQPVRQDTHHTGSWRCSKCGVLVIGNKCWKCGNTR